MITCGRPGLPAGDDAARGRALEMALAERDSNRDQERRLQAEWLVESGLERAACSPRGRCAAMRGETWPISAADLGLPEASQATGAADSANLRGGCGHDLGRSPRWSDRTTAGACSSRLSARRATPVAAFPGTISQSACFSHKGRLYKSRLYTCFSRSPGPHC